MMEDPFDAKRLRKALDVLDQNGRLAFLLSCAERLRPNYIEFARHHHWGDETPLRHALDLGWRFLADRHIDDKEIRDCLHRCESVTPDTEDFDSKYVSAGLDAAICCTLVLECLLEDDPQKVVEAASLARDTVDMYVQELEAMDANASNLEERILAHPLMQRELARQRSDIERLSGVSMTPGVVQALENDWRSPASSNIELPA